MIGRKKNCICTAYPADASGENIRTLKEAIKENDL